MLFFLPPIHFFPVLCYHQILHNQHSITFLTINPTYTAPRCPLRQTYIEEYLLTLNEHHPTLFPLFFCGHPRHPASGLCPALSSQHWLSLFHGSPPLPHTDSAGRQLASYQGKWKHTITHSFLGSEKGGNHLCFDWTADSELCLKFSSELSWRYSNERVWCQAAQFKFRNVIFFRTYSLWKTFLAQLR